MEQYLGHERRLDLALCYRDPDGNVPAWVRFVRDAMRRFGAHAGMLQIGEEPNAAGGGYHFGVMRDDYTPKPAFQLYRQLVDDLSGRCA